ncbi:hypothetical protein L873DRAFT_245288 [Choiromyces venosus 120613-1]|uniref:Uncharacterized protein n=1 Tax=Choiromyces venosus 120613-1 TaxID=1336337 RepID=A0A3N4J6F4_9PEZI|nr:hypothetical protein L873DRAFT_245288 [Choiromyces venosus 120613-1]
MVCGAEDYTWVLFDLVPSGRTEGYRVSWKSGELLWTVKVCVTCEFRRITCSRIAPAQGKPITFPQTHSRLLKAWAGNESEELIRRHRLGFSEKGGGRVKYFKPLSTTI